MFYLTHQQRDWLDSISYVPAETIASLDIETTNDAAKALTDDELLTLSYILRDPITDIESSETVSLSVIQKQLGLAPENHPILVSLIKKNVFCMTEGKIIFLGFKSDYPRPAPTVVSEPLIPAAAEPEHHAEEIKPEKPVSPNPSNVEDLNTDVIRSLRESLSTIKDCITLSREPAKIKKQKRFQALISLSSADTLLDILEERLAKAARIPASSPEGSAVTDSRREPAAVDEVAPEQLDLNAELKLAYEELDQPAQDNNDLVSQIECYSPLMGQSLFQRTASPPPVVAVVEDIEVEIEINVPKLS